MNYKGVVGIDPTLTAALKEPTNMEVVIRNLMQIVVPVLAAILSTLIATAAADDKVTSESLAALIDELVLTDKDTFVMNGQSYLSRDASDRIERAAEQLRAAGKDAWPQLFANLSDKRKSTPSASVTGPYDVGQKCYYILRFQIMDFPRGYPYSLLLAYHQISFRPSLETWLKQRQNRTLDEIRYEVISNLIDMESYANNRKAVDLLEPHLAKIEERIKQATQPQQGQIQSIPRP